MAKHKASRGAGRPPGATRPVQMPPPAAVPGGRKLRWLQWTAGIVGLAVLGLFTYSALLVYQFQHAIYHPLPTAVPTLVPVSTSVPTLDLPSPTTLPQAPTMANASTSPIGLAPTLAPASPPPPTPAPPGPTVPPTEVPAAGRINILILGTDKRPELQEAAARSDTLIVLSVDPSWKTAGILSVPRDLQVPIPGYGRQKINAAYFYGEYDHLPGGGAGLAVTTVSQYFGVPIPYYIAINFTGFEQIIDSLGGIDVSVPTAIDDPLYPGPGNSYIHVHFDAGCQHLDGVRALEYARTRHSDSDFGRSKRQQQVIQAVRARVLQLNMLPRYGLLLGQLGNAIETNIPPDQQMQFAQLAGQIAAQDIYSAQIDNTLVSQIAGTSDLALDWGQAHPLLDWFFGRGLYARQKPGTRLAQLPLPPDPTPDAAASTTGRCS